MPMSLSCLLFCLCSVRVQLLPGGLLIDQKSLLVGSLVLSTSHFAIVDLLPYWSTSVGTAVALGWVPGRSHKWWGCPGNMSHAQGVSPNLSISEWSVNMPTWTLYPAAVPPLVLLPLHGLLSL